MFVCLVGWLLCLFVSVSVLLLACLVCLFLLRACIKSQTASSVQVEPCHKDSSESTKLLLIVVDCYCCCLLLIVIIVVD